MEINGGRPARLLAKITVAPALLLTAWLVVGLPLLMAGAFGIGLTLVLFVPVAVVVLRLVLRGPRVQPAEEASPRPGRSRRTETPWWAVAGVVVVAVAFFALQLAMLSEQVIVRRDPGSYIQFATWLADHGSLPIPQDRWAFGGADPALMFESPAFYERGYAIIPQFMAGLPMILAAAGWVGGTYAMLAMMPILGALAVLSFGGLVARLAGARWAPLGALALALTMPMMLASRSAVSETAVLVLLLGGLSLALDSRELPPVRARVYAALAGLALGLTVLVRIDALRDVLPVLAVAGGLFALRRPGGLSLLAGVAVGAAAGLLEGFVLSGPYLNYLRDSLIPLLELTGAVLFTTAVGVVLLRWRPARQRLAALSGWVGRSRVPDLAAVLTVLVMAAFALRPWLQTVRRAPRTPGDKVNVLFMAATQKANGLPIDPTRQYSELSLYWVTWYIGLPAVLLATFGAALLMRRLLRRRGTQWVLPVTMIMWTTVTTLYRPGITPDHPWASRRLLPIVIPGLILLAVWALSWVVRRVRRIGYGRNSATWVAGVGVVLLLAPTVAISGALMFTRVERGELAAVRGLCREIGPGASVLILDRATDRATGDRFSQVVRGMCGAPTARIRTAAPATKSPDPAVVQRIVGKIVKAGRRPVLLGSTAADVAPYGPPELVLRLRTTQDERSLVSPPNGTWRLVIDVWLTQPS